MMLGLYTLPQWVLLFFSYGFLGWVWESGYVSVRQKHWVNRGFLHGPVIPVYGFGAVAILALCAPVAGSLPMLFFSGMFWATALEYATGWAMERMFHVRYWDYSMEKWNLNGYICLMASLCWGVFSVLLLRVIQPPVAGIITALSGPATAMLATALTLAFAADVAASTREALDLRRLLEQLSASREQIARLQRRLEIAGVFLQQDARDALDGLRKEGERAAGVVSLLWVAAGYSLAFGDGFAAATGAAAQPRLHHQPPPGGHGGAAHPHRQRAVIPWHQYAKRRTGYGPPLR